MLVKSICAFLILYMSSAEQPKDAHKMGTLDKRLLYVCPTALLLKGTVIS